jgi:hypothetical protein
MSSTSEYSDFKVRKKMARMPNERPLPRNDVTPQVSLAKDLFLAGLQITPAYSLESHAGVRQNLRKGEQYHNQCIYSRVLEKVGIYGSNQHISGFSAISGYRTSGNFQGFCTYFAAYSDAATTL